MEKDITIPVILGTAREGCSSRQVFEFVLDHLEDGSEATFPSVPVRDYSWSRTYEAWNEHEEIPEIAEWREIAKAADGYIIVTPEYNHGYPGELKLLLDSAFKEYFDKPVMLVGVSGGSFGGTRVVENLKPVLIELGMKPTGRAVYFSQAGDIFSDEALAETKREEYTKKLDGALEPLLDYARQLRDLRGKT